MADSSQDIADLHKVEEDTERIRELTEKGKEQYKLNEILLDFHLSLCRTNIQ
jgi:hypothetical protein